jgi:hypothetical protein
LDEDGNRVACFVQGELQQVVGYAQGLAGMQGPEAKSLSRVNSASVPNEFGIA